MVTYPFKKINALDFRQVTKKYGKQTVLAGIDLEISAGESFALVGANGVGKTTLIKALLDFIPLEGGDIHIFGKSALNPTSRQQLAYLPERFLPPYFFSGWDFLNYMGQLYDQILQIEEVKELFFELNLDASALEKSVRSFSKGMTQKLGLAALFLSKKKLLILDEPMSGLDPKARVLLKRKLNRLRAEGYTLFSSTHLLADVEELCDRMAILHMGQLCFVGSPAQCLAQYHGKTLEESFLVCIEK
ncbi:MAG: ABC transporter ATP-binding protein [Magnetococcus sp. DMHC-6]